MFATNLPDEFMDLAAIDDLNADLDEMIGPTVEDMVESMKDASKTKLKWNDVKATDRNNFVTFNHARSQAFQQLKTEVTFFREKWRGLYLSSQCRSTGYHVEGGSNGIHPHPIKRNQIKSSAKRTLSSVIAGISNTLNKIQNFN